MLWEPYCMTHRNVGVTIDISIVILKWAWMKNSPIQRYIRFSNLGYPITNLKFNDYDSYSKIKYQFCILLIKSRQVVWSIKVNARVVTLLLFPFHHVFHSNRRCNADIGENPIRFGIIGCAAIARKVARAIHLAPNATLSAIGSRSIEKARNFAVANGLPPSVEIYGSYDEVLDDPSVDVVYLPLPTSLHIHWAVVAAKKKKHLLLEKPTALHVSELDQILDACRSNAVQFMDGSMWLHHPRTAKMKDLLSDRRSLGNVNFVHSTSTLPAGAEFLENNIRVKPELDGLGALGDLAWYCIGAILWAKDYTLPAQVTALPSPAVNSAGVILSCSSSLHWQTPPTTATLHCSFLSHSSMDLAISASNGSLFAGDFIIPFEEDYATFQFTKGVKFNELSTGWNVEREVIGIALELPQEALMVEEMARLVKNIRFHGSDPDE